MRHRVLALAWLAGVRDRRRRVARRRRSWCRTPRSTACCSRADEVNSIMGTSGMTPHTPVVADGRHRNLLPNLNCLGVWQVNEARSTSPVIGSRCASSCFGHRTPTSGTTWSCSRSSPTAPPTRPATSSPSRRTDGRSAPTTTSTSRSTASRCPKWRSGDLTKTDTRLAMPYTRANGDQTRSCQRVLARRRQRDRRRPGVQAAAADRRHAGRRRRRQDRIEAAQIGFRTCPLRRPRRKLCSAGRRLCRSRSVPSPAVHSSSVCQRWQRDPMWTEERPRRAPD